LITAAAESVSPSKHVAVQGTVSSKKKKMAKLKRVMAQVKKQDRREKRDTDQNFAAIQLLHDPQVLPSPMHGCKLCNCSALCTEGEYFGQGDEHIYCQLISSQEL